MIDLDAEAQLYAVERSVTPLEREGHPAHTVTLSRSYTTTIENLWDAITSKDRIPRWSLPITGDLKPGGHYQLEGNAGGSIIECQRPSHFALTWEFGGDTSWVEVDCSSDGDGSARLILTHTSRLSEHWSQYGPGAVGVGWELALLGLSIHIAHPDQPMPDETEFATSQEGRALITGSSERWAQAAVAAGTEPDAAREAANRTTAFYTGESAGPA